MPKTGFNDMYEILNTMSLTLFLWITENLTDQIAKPNEFCMKMAGGGSGEGERWHKQTH